MKKTEEVELTNMCMVYDNDGNVLVQNRKKDSWSGITFPGGHIEPGESFVDAVIREVKEETGLVISNVKVCGLKQWETRDGHRYIVICYKTCSFSGKIVSSNEGEVYWTKLEEINKEDLASGMEYMIQLFINDNVSEHFLERNNENTYHNILK